MANDPTPKKAKNSGDQSLYVQTYRGRMVVNSDWFHYGPGVNQNIACDIAAEADRELAEKEARIRELEEALGNLSETSKKLMEQSAGLRYARGEGGITHPIIKEADSLLTDRD